MSYDDIVKILNKIGIEKDPELSHQSEDLDKYNIKIESSDEYAKIYSLLDKTDLFKLSQKQSYQNIQDLVWEYVYTSSSDETAGIVCVLKADMMNDLYSLTLKV